MKLDVRAFGIAAGNVAAAAFVLCGLFFRVAPGAAEGFFDLLLHTNMGSAWRVPGWGEIVLGAAIWWLLTALFVSVSAAGYNRVARG